MGRKNIVPYALYRAEGYISANLARKSTGFSEEDLELLWDAIINMFEIDHSAARGKMAVRRLIVFKHSKESVSYKHLDVYKRQVRGRGEHMQYYAHISDDKVRRQTVKEHLTGTARRSELFAEAFRCGAWGYGCGILHDIGKYSQGFRKRLEGGSITDHATAGAQEMMGLYARTNPLAAYCAAYCISGHHSGLLDGRCV